jgi:hypothetical protein
MKYPCYRIGLSFFDFSRSSTHDQACLVVRLWWCNHEFFADIFNKHRSGGIQELDDPRKISWKWILERREAASFPEVSDYSGGRDDRTSEANRLIRILNNTDDVVVFRIAINALLFVIQGKISYRPYFDGKEYPPDRLEAALEDVEESALAQ